MGIEGEMIMKIKTSELTAPALDWAVAICEGINLFETEGWQYTEEGRKPYRPSANWAQGGPIIEREKITLMQDVHPEYPTEGIWDAECVGALDEDGYGDIHTARHERPLIAAMRCYVASKLGDEVEVPEELL